MSEKSPPPDLKISWKHFLKLCHNNFLLISKLSFEIPESLFSEWRNVVNVGWPGWQLKYVDRL